MCLQVGAWVAPVVRFMDYASENGSLGYFVQDPDVHRRLLGFKCLSLRPLFTKVFDQVLTTSLINAKLSLLLISPNKRLLFDPLRTPLLWRLHLNSYLLA